LVHTYSINLIIQILAFGLHAVKRVPDCYKSFLQHFHIILNVLSFTVRSLPTPQLDKVPQECFQDCNTKQKFSFRTVHQQSLYLRNIMVTDRNLFHNSFKTMSSGVDTAYITKSII
jgi:hypothetical protein